MRCKDIKIDPCFACSRVLPIDCWIIFYMNIIREADFQYIKLYYIDIVKQDLSYKSTNNIQPEREKYLTIAIQLMYPEYIENIKKLKVLI